VGIKIYLDSCLVIYLVEEHPIFALILENLIARQTDLIVTASNLTAMECFVMPLRNNNKILIKKFENWFEQIQVVSFEKEIFYQAARLRADFTGLKTPDALHLAAAVYHNCNEFWTNDNRLDKVVPNLVKNILTI